MKRRSAVLLLIVLLGLLLMAAPCRACIRSAHLRAASAQLTVDQRVHDFQNLAALYAKRYAPADWKRVALGFDLFDLKPWLDRVRAAKDDLEFFEIEAEYVGRLQDTHSGFAMPSSFRANLGFTVDIYDGKVLIDSINRTTLPAATFTVQVGDELVSVDSVSVEDWIRRISTWRQYGNPVSTRRMAAAQITSRTQSVFPRVVETGDSASLEIRRMSGVLERFTLPWFKTGVPMTKVGPVPSPRTLLSADDALKDLHNYELPRNDLARSYVSLLGAPFPIFRAGFPTNFVQRLNGTVFHYSGTYQTNGLTIGYLRFPNFSPNIQAAINELRTEIEFLERNTDGLVVDVMRNTGGGCYMMDAAAALIPYPFYFFGEELRPTQALLNSFQTQLEIAQSSRAPQAVIDTWQSYVNQVKTALEANRGMTAPIAACRQFGQTTAPVTNNNTPWPNAYTKPVIVLIDEFSISAGDIFPAMIQDNERALMVGARSNGAGGSVSGWPSGLYSESASNNTNSLVVRNKPIVTSDYPAAPYVENIGVRPDVSLQYMTRDNLLNGGRTFVDQFTQVLTREIRIKGSETPFTVADRGAVTHVTPGASGQTVVGYGRVKGNFGSTTPGGMAILGLRQNGVLISETSVSAAPLVQSGRVYAEIDGAVNTGLAIANPGSSAATVSFYFTGPNGNFGNGTTTVPAYGHVAAFLDQSPFNATKPLIGSFTFNSTVPIAVTGLRGYTNERGDFLISTLPLADLSSSAAQAAGMSVFPHFANGEGWTTQIALVNPTDNLLTGTIQFLGADGSPLTLTLEGQTGTSFNYSIAARASQRLRTSGTPASAQVGSVRILPAFTTPRPSGVAIFSFRKDGITVAEAGVTAAATGSAFRVYVEAAGSLQSGLAISNVATTAAAVTLELFTLDGSPMGVTGSITVPANGQVSKFLNEIPGFASQGPFQGMLRISSAATISVIGLRGRYNERNDFLITTTPPSNEATPATSAELFFPHFAEAGGYTTQFILFSSSAAQRSSGVLRLFSTSGEPLNLLVR
jgi:hypothetical protein